ncbi:hypothetical protein [Frankia gtarii]|uniref:hypothetical protein n=1 Tax=Frankia gtarii TaxID=2950102 RepID=UPI0021C06222|nr:hypothetical protein [Frankia gtarii]
MSSNPVMFRALVVALCITLVLVVGLVAGVLAFANGSRPAGAALVAGGAFGGALAPGMSVVSTLCEA